MRKLLLVCGLVLTLLSSLLFAENVVIKYAHWNALPSDSYNYVKAFEEKYPNVKIEFMQIPEAEYSQKLRTMAMTGTAPDIFCLWESDLADFVKAGWIVSLDNYVQQSKELDLDDFIPAVKQLMQLQGHLYGLPWCFATEIMYYNKTLFDKAGVPYPNANWTWKDFENAARKLTITNNGRVTQWGCDAISFQGLWYSIIGTFGDKIVDEKGRFALGDGAKEFLTWWLGLTKDGVVAAPQISTSGVVSADLFMAGKAGMSGKDVDFVAREVVQKSKYSEFCFRYGLGHGIGLEVHEEPRFSPKATDPLPENAVVTIEPGIYIPGEFGIRIENDVIVKSSSFETITTL